MLRLSRVFQLTNQQVKVTSTRAGTSREWMAGYLLPKVCAFSMSAALVVWLLSTGIIDFGCENWRHQTCGIFFRCARCVHVVQNLYWLARARLYSSSGCSALVVLAAVVLCALFCGSRSHRCDQHPDKVAPGSMSLRRWGASALSVSFILAVCNLRNQPRPGWVNERQLVAQRPSQLVVFSENWHGDEWGRWSHLLGLAGIRLTDNPADRDSAHVTIDNDNCHIPRVDSNVTAKDQLCCAAHSSTPKVWAFSMYNGHPQQEAMHGAFENFFPHVFSDCKYWFTKDEREAQVFRRAGLKVLAIPYFYTDITPAAGEWDRVRQVEINGFFNDMGSRSPQDFVDAYRIKRDLANLNFHFHGNDALDSRAENDTLEFAKTKFTVHIKHQSGGPPYWCNSVARSVASGVPVVMDKASWRRGLFEPLVIHNVSGVVLESTQDIITYLRQVSDDEYIRLRNSTRHFGRFLREPPSPMKVQETRDFFWTVYRDRSWVFEGKPVW